MMWNIRLLQQIFSDRWFIEKGYEQQMAPLILKALLDGKPLEGINAGYHVKMAKNDGYETYGWRLEVIENGKVRKIDSFSEAAYDAIALVHLDGPVMRSDGWCSMGTETMGRIIKGADQSPNISAIILESNSPGGQVAGTEQLASIIEAVETPVYTYSHFSASAAYWIAAPTKEIWSSARSNEFGSIGTMVGFKDFSGYFEQLGIQHIEIYASDSTDKNLPFREALKGNYDPMREEVLDPINQIFTSEVKRLRNLSDEVLTGKLYLAETAIEKGLIDRIGTREELIEHIQSQHGGQQANTSFSLNTLSMAETTEQNQTWLQKLGVIFPNQQALASLKQELEQATTDRDDWKGKYEALEQQHNALNTKHTTLEAQVQTLTQERDQWKATAEEYGAQPGTFASTPKKEESDDIGQDKGFKVNQGAEHNQMAMELLSRKKGNKKP